MFKKSKAKKIKEKFESAVMSARYADCDHYEIVLCIEEDNTTYELFTIDMYTRLPQGAIEALRQASDFGIKLKFLREDCRKVEA